MYTCREIEKLLDTYTDGELDEPVRLMVETHLLECVLCAQLARRMADEARLLHSGTLVPALSADFTKRVVSNLSRSQYQARYEGFFSLRKLSARPWLAPALAGLLLLITVSWAASGHLLPSAHVSSANNSPALTLPMAGVSGPTDRFPNKKATASGKSARPWSGRTVALSPSKNPNTVSEAVYKTVETQTTNPGAPQATSTEELEQQGYTVFEPGYLPAGYSLASCYLLPTGSGTESGAVSQGTAPLQGSSSLLLTYRNAQTGGWFILEIQPVNSKAPVTGSAISGEKGAGAAPPPSAGPETSHTANTTTGGATGNQPSAYRITWQAQKHGASFLLTVGGSLPEEELQKVAASVQ